jgi:hypothetical protein
MRGRAVKPRSVMLDGTEYPLSEACELARISYDTTRHHIYYRGITAQEAFDLVRAKKAEKTRKLTGNLKKLPVKPYEPWTPPK